MIEKIQSGVRNESNKKEEQFLLSTLRIIHPKTRSFISLLTLVDVFGEKHKISKTKQEEEETEPKTRSASCDGEKNENKFTFVLVVRARILFS